MECQCQTVLNCKFTSASSCSCSITVDFPVLTVLLVENIYCLLIQQLVKKNSRHIGKRWVQFKSDEFLSFRSLESRSVTFYVYVVAHPRKCILENLAGCLTSQTWCSAIFVLINLIEDLHLAKEHVETTLRKCYAFFAILCCYRRLLTSDLQIWK